KPEILTENRLLLTPRDNDFQHEEEKRYSNQPVEIVIPGEMGHLVVQVISVTRIALYERVPVSIHDAMVYSLIILLLPNY
ncbi:MAG: hypothetical protein ACI974_002165, partial [Paraglaciecola sp.]